MKNLLRFLNFKNAAPRDEDVARGVNAELAMDIREFFVQPDQETGLLLSDRKIAADLRARDP